MKIKATLFVLLLSATCASTQAPAPAAKSTPPAKSPLYDEIAQVDAEMFAAFNAHNADKLASYFDEGLEFYHDKGGLVGFNDTVNGLRGNLAQNNGLRRDLVPGSLEVYPIRDYGAIEVGAHRFCHVEDGKDDCGTFKFVHIWQKQPRGWKITRVVSYDH